jgi:hypothetical protein
LRAWDNRPTVELFEACSISKSKLSSSHVSRRGNVALEPDDHQPICERSCNMRTILSKLAVGSIFLAVSTELAISQVSKPESASGPSISGLSQSISEWSASHPGAAIAIVLGALFLVGWTIYHRRRPNG